MVPVKVLVADDHPLMREGLVRVMRIDSSIEVVGEAADGEAVVKKAGELQPDVVVMDLHMPRMGGLEATRAIKKLYPRIKIIALTVEDSEQRVIEVIKAGAEGYVLKDIHPDALASTIRAVHAGETVIHPGIAAVLFRKPGHAIETAATRLEGGPGENTRLTPREIQVLEYLAMGVHNKEIADNLFISEKTVKNHITSIFRKLQVEDRTQAALSAIKMRLVRF